MRHITFIRPKLGEGAPADAMTPLVFALLKGATPADIDTVLIDERVEPYSPVPTDLVAISVESFTARRAYEIAEDYRMRGVPVVMRCPNYRLFCPSGLHLSHGQVCERCLGGKEYWCVLRNCENDGFKSLGYALRNAVARITRSILDNVSIFIVLSQFQKQRFIHAGIPAHRLEILPNVVPQANGDGSDQIGELVTFVGRASPEKGIGDFVAAARHLPDLPFAVAGATDRVPDLVASSPPNVRWLGFLKEKELNEAYTRSRVLVFPFRWFEGFPNVITHSMALQRPVLASRIGAVPEIVDEGRTGLLFDTGNVDDLVTKLRTLYADKARCREMGAAGRAKALAAYGPEGVYTRLMEIYQQALTNGLS